jgi:ABC-type nitrate/sulfonate/bicarbonate transport system substrate-binding protein
MGIPARFAVAQRSTAECLGLFAAARRLFERRGVDFDLVAFETAAERGVEGLIAGEWDYIEIGIIPLVRLRADGHDPAIVVGTTPMNTNFLMARHDITRATELAGGRIGCLSFTGQTAAVARAVLARSGVADAVKLVPLGKYPKIFDAISVGDIDGAILAGDFRFLGEARHGTRVIADIGSEIKMPGTCVVTTRREIARKPELAKQIVGTYFDALHAFKTQPDVAKAFLHKHLEFEEDVIERIFEYYRSIFQTRPSLPHIQVAIDDIAKVRPDVSGMTPADLIETRFHNEINAESH